LLPDNYINGERFREFRIRWIFHRVFKPAPRPVLENLVNRYLSYSEPSPLRVAIGTYNINGGKHFRSIVYKDVSLSDWLLDAHKTPKESGKSAEAAVSRYRINAVLCLSPLAAVLYTD
jgi:hypothetical protein